MLSILRKLRLKLLSKRKFSKYLLYAVGEIILVVVGILIALQINTWNEGYTTKEKELKYLLLIKQEMLSNLQSINMEREILDDYFKGLEQILEAYAHPDPNITNKELSGMLAPILSNDMDINFKSGTLNEIIANGNLKDITNDSIRNILASIDGNLERLRAQETRVNDYIAKGNSILEKKGSIKQLVSDFGVSAEYGIPKNTKEVSNLFLLKDQEFENIMVLAVLTGVSLDEEHYFIFEKEIKTLINLIDKELRQ
ncbi:MAG: hypothetical protein AAF634_11740 [Bacteroidota bacterium]